MAQLVLPLALLLLASPVLAQDVSIGDGFVTDKSNVRTTSPNCCATADQFGCAGSVSPPGNISQICGTTSCGNEERVPCKQNNLRSRHVQAQATPQEIELNAPYEESETLFAQREGVSPNGLYQKWRFPDSGPGSYDLVEAIGQFQIPGAAPTNDNNSPYATISLVLQFKDPQSGFEIGVQALWGPGTVAGGTAGLGVVNAYTMFTYFIMPGIDEPIRCNPINVVAGELFSWRIGYESGIHTVVAVSHTDGEMVSSNVAGMPRCRIFQAIEMAYQVANCNFFSQPASTLANNWRVINPIITHTEGQQTLDLNTVGHVAGGGSSNCGLAHVTDLESTTKIWSLGA